MIHGKFVKFVPKPIVFKQEFCVEDSVGVFRSKAESHGVERIHHLFLYFISLSPVNLCKQKVKAMVKLFRRF